MIELEQASIAIVIPVYNEEETLPNTIVMLKQLDISEVVFSDGGSTDNSSFLIIKSGFRSIVSQARRSTQMNAGARHSAADILLFVHADSIIHSDHIQAIRDVMQDERFVGGRFDITLSGSHWMFRVIEYFINLRSRLTGISTGDQCQFVRRDLFEKMSGFANQALMEDIEFSKQLKRHGKVACLRQKVITSSRRWENKGVLRTVWLMWKLRCLYYLGVSPHKLAKIYRNVR